LRSHPGTREVHLRIEGGAKETTFRLDDGLRITASPGLSADLKSILGPDCLV
jgi:DNA polymerase-3 subunit alpha